MCIACCDPAKLPKAAYPNCMTAPPSTWITVDVAHPSLVIQVGDFGHYSGTSFWAFPELQPSTSSTTCVYRVQGSGSLYLHAPGRWKIFHNGSSAVSVMVLDSYCDAAFQAYARTGYSQPTHTAITLAAATSTLVLAANVNRSYALFVNDGANDAYLSLGPAAVANNGILIVKTGGSYEMADGNLWRGPVNGISTAGTSILVTEGV